MVYDPADRLQSVSAPGLWGLALYAYDELGNRTLKHVGDDVTYSYDANNRLRSSTEAPSRGTMTLTWDGEGRLATSSDGALYRYNGQGLRVLKRDGSGVTVYHHDGAGRVIAETRPDGTLLREYFFFAGQLVAVHGCVAGSASCSALEWYHTDTLGSATARTDASGNVTSRVQYDPWGGEWSEQGEMGARRFNGRVHDPGTGFHDYGARLYWPEMGRFASADTVLGKSESVASLNRYSYAWNNPYKFIDPSGHSVFVVGDPEAYETATAYLRQDPAMREAIDQLQSPDTPLVTVVVCDTCKDSYKPSAREIRWNPKLAHTGFADGSGPRTESGEPGVQSPAMALGHELAHAAGHGAGGPAGEEIVDYPAGAYVNMEEMRVITGPEASAARTLGEDARMDHRGKSVHVSGPLDRTVPDEHAR
ncbi:MAG: RHS repeat-associated core domain-containing protein [Anaeromyxobacter sp.]